MGVSVTSSLFLRDIKKMQMDEMRRKATSKFEKLPEEIYGLNQKSPAKKTPSDKLFESQLKRHVIRSKAEKLQQNIEDFYVQGALQKHFKAEQGADKYKRPGSIKELDSVQFASQTHLASNTTLGLAGAGPSELLTNYQGDSRISNEDIKDAVKLFFDDIEQNGDKQSKDVFKERLAEIMRDDHGTHLRRSIEHIQELDNQIKIEKREKRIKAKQNREEKMDEIFKHTPYAFEACRFDRIMNPQKWYNP